MARVRAGRALLLAAVSSTKNMTAEIVTLRDDSASINGGKYVILFTAEWHEACAVNGPMDQLLHALASSTDKAISFARCDAEANPTLTERLKITSVPTFCLVEDGTPVERVEGETPATVTTAVQRFASNNTSSRMAKTQTGEESLTERLDSLIRSGKVMLFMKGSPTEPKCGFSRQIVEILESERIAFRSFDILTDESIRQGLKEYSKWPTYPQLYCNGDLIGGLDIIKEMMTDGGDLAEQLGVSKQPSLNERLKSLIEQSPVMVFMKGLPSQPRCGFSRQMVELLDELKVPYDTFDILSDESVRQGLKTYSNWPTFPQLYIRGELIGGLDIAKEMATDGSLQDALQA